MSGRRRRRAADGGRAAAARIAGPGAVAGDSRPGSSASAPDRRGAAAAHARRTGHGQFPCSTFVKSFTVQLKEEGPSASMFREPRPSARTRAACAPPVGPAEPLATATAAPQARASRGGACHSLGPGPPPPPPAPRPGLAPGPAHAGPATDLPRAERTRYPNGKKKEKRITTTKGKKDGTKRKPNPARQRGPRARAGTTSAL